MAVSPGYIDMARKGVATRMRAWRIHGYGALSDVRLEESRVPPLRSPDQLLVQVHATSVNPLDVAMIGGYGARILNVVRRAEGVGIEFPLVVGRDLVGRVVRAGNSARFRVGDRVWAVVPPQAPGCHAQYALVRDGWAGAAPDRLPDLEAGGALYAALSAAAALRAAGAWPPTSASGAGSRRVLLLGLGGTGRASLQMLVYGGWQVVVGCSGDLTEDARALGAELVLDRHSPDYARALEEAGPYQSIVDCAGLGGWEASARRWRFSRYVTLTSPLLRATDSRGVVAGAACAAAELAAQSGAAARAQGGGGGAHVRWAYFRAASEDIEALRALAERGGLGVRVERVFPWWRADEAYARAADGHARGKILLDFAAEEGSSLRDVESDA